MKNLAIGLLATLAAVIFFGDFATAQVRPSNDPFESRRRDAQYRENLRRQQAAAQQRPAVPTFTIPQPALNNGYNNGYNNNYYNNGFNNNYGNQYDPRYDQRYYDRNYVYIPAHYQNIRGQLIHVPAHFEYVGR